MASSLYFLLLLLLLVQLCSTTAAGKFPAILIFGDSLLDTGNNNFIPTTVRANHVPYGQDFPGKIPTGRFSNGKLVSDMLASYLGIKDAVPPFLDPNLAQSELRTGVCFASAGSGYDDMTTALSRVIPVSKQPDYLRQYIGKLKGAVGEQVANGIVNGALVVVFSGSNDITISYPSRRLQYPTPGAYHDFLQGRIQDFVKELYNQGLRNILIAGLPPLADAQAYNQKLVAMLPRLQASLPGSKLVYADIFTPLLDMFTNPRKYGFLVVDRPCCSGLCSQFSPVCPNPSQYLRWDFVHPSEAAYKIISQFLENNALPQFSR